LQSNRRLTCSATAYAVSAALHYGFLPLLLLSTSYLLACSSHLFSFSRSITAIPSRHPHRHGSCFAHCSPRPRFAYATSSHQCLGTIGVCCCLCVVQSSRVLLWLLWQRRKLSSSTVFMCHHVLPPRQQALANSLCAVQRSSSLVSYCIALMRMTDD
jgi:hypothetical protein